MITQALCRSDRGPGRRVVAAPGPPSLLTDREQLDLIGQVVVRLPAVAERHVGHVVGALVEHQRPGDRRALRSVLPRGRALVLGDQTSRGPRAEKPVDVARLAVAVLVLVRHPDQHPVHERGHDEQEDHPPRRAPPRSTPRGSSRARPAPRRTTWYRSTIVSSLIGDAPPQWPRPRAHVTARMPGACASGTAGSRRSCPPPLSRSDCRHAAG
jgi:hypothetical protein